MFNKNTKADLARYTIYKLKDAKDANNWEIMSRLDFERLHKGVKLLETATLEQALPLIVDYIRWATETPRYTIEVLPEAARAYEQVALWV